MLNVNWLGAPKVAGNEKQHFLYRFEAVRPEMVTDPDSWSEEDIRIGSDHFNYLREATEAGTVILAG